MVSHRCRWPSNKVTTMLWLFWWRMIHATKSACLPFTLLLRRMMSKPLCSFYSRTPPKYVLCTTMSLSNIISHPIVLLKGENRAHTVSWPRLVKVVPNQGLVWFVSRGCYVLFLFCVADVCSILLLFGCHYQCGQLPGNTHLWNDLLCVKWDIEPYTLTHSLWTKNGEISNLVEIWKMSLE